MSAVWYNISKINTRELDEFKNDDDTYFTITVPKGEAENHAAARPRSHNVMPSESETAGHAEAYYLYFIATVGIILNCAIVMVVFVRKPLRKMTSGFLIHACFLDLMKSAYCIPMGTNLLSQTAPSDCNFSGATFVIIVTISVFNMVAMVCTEAYTFGEQNIGGNSRGTLICVVFGIILVYVGSIILHLGPTLIGGHFEFQKEIGSCSFILGKQTGYVANVMWISITTIAIFATIHFIRKLYKEIQINRPNRVSFLVRTSITVLDSHTRSTCRLRQIIKDASHRAKIFIMNTVVFVVFWYPLYMLIVIDTDFKAPVPLYQTFAFIAWSHAAIQPMLYILFDRNLNLLAKYTYCCRYRYDIDTIAQLMMNRARDRDRDRDRESVPSDHIRHSPPDPSLALPLPPSVLRGVRVRENHCDVPLDILHEHHQMCAVQNSSNQDAADQRVVNFRLMNNDNLDLTNQLSRDSTVSVESVDMSTPSGAVAAANPHLQQSHDYYNADMAVMDVEENMI